MNQLVAFGCSRYEHAINALTIGPIFRNGNRILPVTEVNCFGTILTREFEFSFIKIDSQNFASMSPQHLHSQKPNQS